MQSIWSIWAGLAFLITFSLTPIVGKIATRLGLVDRPNGEAKKIHKKPIPFSGISIYIGFSVILIILLATSDVLTSGLIGVKEYSGFLIGGFILMIGGYLDDRFTLPIRDSKR